MPLWRFNSAEDAERSLWHAPGDPALVDTWKTLSALSALAPVCPPIRGVRKFSSIEAANADTEAWIARRIEAGRRRIG